MLAQGAWRSVVHLTRRVSRADPLAALLGCVMLGALFGGLSGLAFPHTIVPAPRIPGLSIVVAPIITGIVMHVYGSWRRRARREPSWLASFAGGGMFAFVFAFVRFTIVHSA